MYPKTLALVDNEAADADRLTGTLRGLGIAVDAFGDSNDLLAAVDPYAYDFYLVDPELPGIDGVDLIRVLRRRSEAGMVVLSGRPLAEVFEPAVQAGADMVLTKPVPPDMVALAVKAVQRRVGSGKAAGTTWKLDRRATQLLAPDGARVDLSDADLALLECFLEARGEIVSREVLRQRLGRNPEHSGERDGLNATIYRLRRRIERATPVLVPLQSRSRIGYVFRAPLLAV